MTRTDLGCRTSDEGNAFLSDRSLPGSLGGPAWVIEADIAATMSDSGNPLVTGRSRQPATDFRGRPTPAGSRWKRNSERAGGSAETRGDARLTT
jgi:hypothetical protein